MLKTLNHKLYQTYLTEPGPKRAAAKAGNKPAGQGKGKAGKGNPKPPIIGKMLITISSITLSFMNIFIDIFSMF